MQNRKWVILALIISLSLVGCGVSRIKPENWEPRNSSTDAFFSKCKKSSTGMFFLNKKEFTICMEAEGLKLRSMTFAEYYFSLITLSFSIVYVAFTGDLIIDYY